MVEGPIMGLASEIGLPAALLELLQCYSRSLTGAALRFIRNLVPWFTYHNGLVDARPARTLEFTLYCRLAFSSSCVMDINFIIFIKVKFSPWL
jgi:hypothetical protein